MRARAWTSVIVAFSFGLLVPPLKGQVHATTFTLAFESTPSGKGLFAKGLEMQRARWEGRVTMGQTRGRMSILQGSSPGFFAAGDLLLFDLATMFVIHPADSSFAVVSSTDSSLLNANGSSAGHSNVASDSVTFNAIGRDSIGERYQIRTTFRLTYGDSALAALAQMPLVNTVDIEQTQDYWFGDQLDGLAGVWLQQRPGSQASRPQANASSLTQKAVAAARRLPQHRLLIQCRTRTRFIQPDSSVAVLEQLYRVRDLAASEVDDSAFTLPANYLETSLPSDTTDHLSVAHRAAIAKWLSRSSTP